ncbi:MAG: hypothetical protein ACJA1L_000907 [Paracoccaceae bacterium]|jgi:hypothetical protein
MDAVGTPPALNCAQRSAPISDDTSQAALPEREAVAASVPFPMLQNEVQLPLVDLSLLHPDPSVFRMLHDVLLGLHPSYNDESG